MNSNRFWWLLVIVGVIGAALGFITDEQVLIAVSGFAAGAGLVAIEIRRTNAD